MIIDYEFYSDNYRGNLIPQEEFKKYAIKSSNEVLLRLFGRDYSNYEELVKTSTCEVADYLYKQEQIKNKVISIATGEDEIITSEKVGDYSKNVSALSTDNLTQINSKENIGEEISNIVESYLLRTGLLYRGI